MKRKAPALIGTLALAAGLIVACSPAQSATCNLSATPSNFAAQVSATAPGQTLCLADGNYGTWTGVNKAITLQSTNGQNAVMGLRVGGGGAGFTLASVTIGYDGSSSNSSTINGGAHDITIKDSKFTGQIELSGQNANILLDHNTHLPMNALSSPARVQIGSVNGQHNVPSGITVQNSFISGGDADGLWTDVGASFLNNELVDVCATGATGNHTDNIQVGIGTPTGVVIQRNFIHQTRPCEQQAVGIFDGLSHATITDNVVQTTRQFGIEVYSDDTSLVAHNTLVDHQITGSRSCDFNLPCGALDIDAKSGPAPGAPPSGGDPGFGTIVKDNAIRFINLNRATLGQRLNNMVEQNLGPGDFLGTPVFVGGSQPTTWAGFCLAAGSPGKGRASDGLDVGIRCNTTPPTTTTTTTTTPVPTTTTTTTPPSGVPTAEYTFTPANPVTGQQVTFNSAPSTCSASPCTYKWEDDAADGPAGDQYPLGTGAVLTFTFQGAGVKNVRLTVTDSLNRTATVMHPVNVTQPVTSAAFTWSPTSPLRGQSVTFDGTTSVCAAAPCSYRWEDDGPDGPGGTQYPLGTGVTLTRTFSGAGTKWVRLIVTDNAGASANVMHPLTVQ